MAMALRLGAMRIDGIPIARSAVRWLHEDGHFCRPGEVIAYCNVALGRNPQARPDIPPPFHDEARDLQMAIATPVSGRLRQGTDWVAGGFKNFQPINLWLSDDVIGHIEPDSGQSAGDSDCEVQLLMMAGRRVTELAEDRSGLLTGWHSRSRACRADGDGPIGTLLSLGICELLGVIKGESFAFLELFEAIKGPAHVAFVPDDFLVPNARVLAEQIRRTPNEMEAITRDLSESLATGTVPPDAADWIYAGALLQALASSPITERYTVLTRTGMRMIGPPDAIILSLHAESASILRHRRLGYALSCHNYRLEDSGRAFLPWLRRNFEPIHRSVEDIHQDYRALIDLIRADAPGTRILIANRMSTSGDGDIQTYSIFDSPLGETLANVRSLDLNLMLCDLARERDVAIIDADAIAAELGGRYSLQDGVHQDGIMQAETRREILRALTARGVPGFEPPSASGPIPTPGTQVSGESAHQING